LEQYIISVIGSYRRLHNRALLLLNGEIIPARKHQFYMADLNESGSGESRLDRMERVMAELAEGHVWFDEEHKRLLAAQARLTERLDLVIARWDNIRRDRI
jgi:hypothetical protein